MFRRALIAVLALAAFAVVAPSALAASQSTSSGSLKATLAYTVKKGIYYNAKLTITNGGQTVYSKAIDSISCGNECAPLSTTKAVKFVDLDGSGSPQLLVELYTMGAHCCQIDQIFAPNAAGTSYTKYERNFGNYGASVKVIGGKHVFEGGNDAFAYAFTDYADSGAPIQFTAFTGHGFADVTRSYPTQVAADAADWLKYFKQSAPHYEDTVGIVADYAADEELLGKDSALRSFLKQQAAEKHLNAPSILKVASNSSYVTQLLKFLKKQGYIK